MSVATNPIGSVFWHPLVPSRMKTPYTLLNRMSVHFKGMSLSDAEADYAFGLDEIVYGLWRTAAQGAGILSC